ncbi:hypothetical protein [Caenimonas soli]|uniref:hypothetical protein n=1 Tax=Caenimonas soli TaxID=2735555 RepID=UPI0015527396|nr:hypothetical protein [Caenimonas soli]NPC56580.1 hypothetical protein [Caenimonas soli]
MAKDLDIPNSFNPVMLWTDLGMRTLEMTLSSSQNISDGLDRLARAGASPEASEVAVAPSIAVSQAPVAATPGLGLNLAAQMQRTTFDLMTQGWLQWMDTVGALVSLGAGRSFGETARQNPLLHAMQEVLQSGSADETAVTRVRPNGPSRAKKARSRNS